MMNAKAFEKNYRMKRTILFSVLISLLFGACLKKDALDVEEFNNNDINDVAGIWYRYVVQEGERDVLKKVELNGIVRTVDKDNRTIVIKVTPSQNVLNSIPPDQRSGLSLKNIAVVVSLPTAARVFPVGSSPKLGVNGDWSQPNKYKVQAANGSEAEWTIHLAELNI